jgi:hypothetical protein
MSAERPPTSTRHRMLSEKQPSADSCPANQLHGTAAAGCSTSWGPANGTLTLRRCLVLLCPPHEDIWALYLKPFVEANEDDLRAVLERDCHLPNTSLRTIESLLLLERLSRVPAQMRDVWPLPLRELERTAGGALRFDQRLSLIILVRMRRRVRFVSDSSGEQGRLASPRVAPTPTDSGRRRRLSERRGTDRRWPRTRVCPGGDRRSRSTRRSCAPPWRHPGRKSRSGSLGRSRTGRLSSRPSP